MQRAVYGCTHAWRDAVARGADESPRYVLFNTTCSSWQNGRRRIWWRCDRCSWRDLDRRLEAPRALACAVAADGNRVLLREAARCARRCARPVGVLGAPLVFLVPPLMKTSRVRGAGDLSDDVTGWQDFLHTMRVVGGRGGLGQGARGDVGCMRSRACGGQRHRYPGCRRAGAAVPSRRPLPRLVGETGPASGRETSRALVCSASEDGRHGHA